MLSGTVLHTHWVTAVDVEVCPANWNIAISALMDLTFQNNVLQYRNAKLQKAGITTPQAQATKHKELETTIER